MKPILYGPKEHKIDADEIDLDALKVIYRLQRHSHKAYLVGGGVRDLLLRKKPKDFDVATDATPRQIKSLFRNGFIIGRRFKLVHIRFSATKAIEVATFRKDSSADNEGLLEPIKHDNSYGTEQTDAYRRDITFNALFLDPVSQKIIDYVNGFNDLNDKIVRVIGDPNIRFSEDPVRMLRVCRHAVRSGSRIEKASFDAISADHQKILLSVPVRIFEELKRDLSSGYSTGIFALLAETKILPLLLTTLTFQHFTPASPLFESLERIDTHFIAGEDFPIVVAFAALILLTKENALKQFEDRDQINLIVKEFFGFLPLPKKDRERIEAMLDFWDFLEKNSSLTVREIRHFKPLVKEDLGQLIKVLPFRPRDREILTLLREAKNAPSKKRRR